MPAMVTHMQSGVLMYLPRHVWHSQEARACTQVGSMAKKLPNSRDQHREPPVSEKPWMCPSNGGLGVCRPTWGRGRSGPGAPDLGLTNARWALMQSDRHGPRPIRSEVAIVGVMIISRSRYPSAVSTSSTKLKDGSQNSSHQPCRTA